MKDGGADVEEALHAGRRRVRCGGGAGAKDSGTEEALRTDHARGGAGRGVRRRIAGKRAEVEVRRRCVRRRGGDVAPDGLR